MGLLADDPALRTSEQRKKRGESFVFVRYTIQLSDKESQLNQLVGYLNEFLQSSSVWLKMAKEKNEEESTKCVFYFIINPVQKEAFI